MLPKKKLIIIKFQLIQFIKKDLKNEGNVNNIYNNLYIEFSPKILILLYS